MAKAVGIDLGTTNSVIATVEGGQPTVIPNAEGSRTTPSVVAFTENGERLVGQLARRQAILNPKATIYSAKRFIGRRFEEAQSELNTVTVDVVPSSDGAVRFKVRGKLFVRLHPSGDSIVVHIDENERAMRMRADPKAYYITDHYLNYPLMLVRFSSVYFDDLRVILEESWRRVAPKRLIAAFDG